MSHSERDHAKLSPSGFAKWGRCPLSLELEETLPPEGDKPYAEWGTARHEEAEAVLTKNAPLPDDPDAREVVEFYTNYCKGLKGSPEIVEAAVTLASYGLPDIYGTADFVAEVGTTLHVVDLKAGISQVSAVDNGQLRIYALGAATAPRLLYYDKIVLTIVQPRVRPRISTEELSPFELVNWFENILKPAVAATKVERPEVNPSEKACQWCRAKPICKAYAERVTALAQQSFNNFAPKDLNSLTPAELGAILPHLGEIEKYLKALKAHSKSYMEQGGVIPGMKLVAGRKGARKWEDEAEARKYFIRKVGKDKLFDLKIKSPAQVEKLLKGTKHNIPEGLTAQSSGSPTMVLESDKREAISSGAEIAFKEFTT